MNSTESIRNIFNDNERYKPKSSLDNDIDEKQVDKIADMLVEKLGSPLSRPYYCLVARKLPEATLIRLAVTAVEVGKHPGKLFTYLTKKEIRENQQRSKVGHG